MFLRARVGLKEPVPLRGHNKLSKELPKEALRLCEALCESRFSRLKVLAEVNS